MRRKHTGKKKDKWAKGPKHPHARLLRRRRRAAAASGRPAAPPPPHSTSQLSPAGRREEQGEGSDSPIHGDCISAVLMRHPCTHSPSPPPPSASSSRSRRRCMGPTCRRPPSTASSSRQASSTSARTSRRRSSPRTPHSAARITRAGCSMKCPSKALFHEPPWPGRTSRLGRLLKRSPYSGT